jgi:DNA-binding MarR family transcriptional regulator
MEFQAKLKSHEWACNHDPAAMPLVLALHWAAKEARASTDALWSRFGVTPTEFDVLATLRNAPPPHELTPSQVQGQMVITSGGLTKVMRQLEERKLVSRSLPGTDQRVKPVRITAAGKRLVERLMIEVSGLLGAWVRDRLGGNDSALLTDLLARLVAPAAPRATAARHSASGRRRPQSA